MERWDSWKAADQGLCIPHLAKNERDTRISCVATLSVTACAAFIEESRMKLVRPIGLDRKSGGMGHPTILGLDRIFIPRFVG
jgi:hypothetical protein